MPSKPIVCPTCGGEAIGVEIQGVYDGVLYWTCASASTKGCSDWHRWPPGHDLRKIASQYLKYRFEKIERNDAIRALMADGNYTLQEVGTTYGLTRERVRQLVKTSAKARGKKSGLLDPIRLMQIIRSDPNATTYGYVSNRYYRRKRSGGDNGSVQATLKALGVEEAVLRLFRWRKRREKRQRQEKAIAFYHAFAEKHGRVPTYADTVGWGVAVPGLFGTKNHMNALHRAAGGTPPKQRGYIYVSGRGDLVRKALELASRPTGVRIKELAKATGTTYESAHHTLIRCWQRGRLVKASQGHYFGLPPAGP